MDVEAHVKDKHDLKNFLGVLTGIVALADSIGWHFIGLGMTASTRA